MAKPVQRYASEDGNDSKSEDGYGSKQLQLIMVSGTFAILCMQGSISNENAGAYKKRCDK